VVAFHSLCSAVGAKLRSFDLKVFQHYINPDPKSDLRNFNQADLARYMGVSEMTISRSLKTIREVAEEVLGAA
jgi:hypothetical protein